MFHTKFKITTDIRALLLQDERLRELVGDRIYPLVAPKDTSEDFIVYKRDEYSVIRDKMGRQQSCIISIAIISNDYDSANSIAEAVFYCLDGTFDLESGDSVKIELVDSEQEFADKKFIEVLEFKVT